MGASKAVSTQLRKLLPGSLSEALPGVAMVREYDRALLRSDLVAGAIVAVVAVPSSLAMGELAGLPVVFGLYATFLPLVGYAIFGSSRHLVVGPDATLATLTAATVAPMAIVDGTTDPARYAALAAALALTMGAILFLAGMLRLGFVADFFGKPVLLGYINGIALTVIAGQLGKMFGLDIDSDDFVAILEEFFSEMTDASGATVALSAALLALALGVKRFVPRVPAPVVVLLAGLIAGSVLDVDELGIAVVGEVEQGLPPIGFPDVSFGDYTDLVLPAVSLALIAFADGIATVRTFAAKHGYDVDANAELRGFGTASLLAGVSSAFPVSSSGSRTAVNDDSGGRSQMMGLAAAAVVGLFLLFLMPLIEPLPKAALGVIVVVAALGLFNIGSVWRLRHVRPAEVGLAISAFLGVLLFGVVGGIVVAIGLSVGVFLYRAARPHDAVLGKVEDADGYHDIERWEDVQTVPGLIVYRFDAPLFFVNSEYLRQRVLALVAASDDVEWVVLNAEAWVYLDATAIDTLKQLQAELAARDVALAFARLKGRQREIFEETGLTEHVGESRFFPTVRSAVAAFESRSRKR